MAGFVFPADGLCGIALIGEDTCNSLNKFLRVPMDRQPVQLFVSPESTVIALARQMRSGTR